MEFNIKNILNIQESSTANYVIAKYLNCVYENIKSLVLDISKYNVDKQYFILPQSNIVIARNIKRLIICGYLIMNELTNNPIAIVQADLIVKNDKLSTPDVLFFLISLMEDFMKKKSNFEFTNLFDSINIEIKKISTYNPEYFDVNLQDYKKIQIENPELESIIDAESK